MKDGLLERIRAYGHWRVNFRPLSAPVQPLLLGTCRELVEKASVSIRGWDFPHISRGRDDGSGGYSTGSDFIENWTDWNGFIEFWRMYQSTQFLSYVALREDTKPEDHGNPQGRVLHFVAAVYQVTEIFEFCHRLAKTGLYSSGVVVKLSLRNTRGRSLVAGRHRVPFFDPYVTEADDLDIETRLDPILLLEDHRSAAIDACIHLFDRFGWNPDPSQIGAEQERFYARNWGY